MIYLDSLILKAFRSFVDETTFVFPKTGLILINGKNLQTNDASGTGKSSIFLGVAYALNILPEGMTAAGLQSFLTKEKMQVTVHLSGPNLGKVVVARGKDTYIEYSSVRFEGATLVNEHLVKIFGLTSEMLYTMAYRPQNSNGLFLSKNDTQKKEFLAALLGLDKIESAIDESESIIKELTKELSIIKTQISSKEEILDKLNIQDISNLEKENAQLVIDISDCELERERLEKLLEEEIKEIKAFDEKYSELKRQCLVHLKNVQAEDVQRIETLNIKNKNIQHSVDECKNYLNNASAQKELLQKLKIQAEALANDSCSMCNRPWDGANGQLENIKKQINDTELYLSKVPKVEDNLKYFQSLIKTFTPDKKISEFQEALVTLDKESKSKRPIGTGSGTMNMISKEMRKMADFTDIFTKNKVKIEKQKEFKMLHDSIGKELELLKAQKTDRESRLQIESDFIKTVGKEGFLGSIFDEVLADIVQNINNKLSNVANMTSVTFNFKTENVNSKGVLKKSIVPTVTILGNETRLSSLSGGMLSSLELVTDLAVKEVIEKRTGRQIGFYFTDEAFNGQGQPTKEACLEILKQSSDTKAFYVIDHNSEFKELFTQAIEVEMENGRSKLV